MNACGIPGRIIPALLADRRIGTINAYILVLLGTSLTILLWPLVKNTPGMYVWASAYGFCAGGTANFLQSGIASLYYGGSHNDDDGDDGDGEASCNSNSNSNKRGKLGVRIGMAFSAVGVAGLIGGPVGGELIKAGEGRGEGGGFLYMQIFTGVLMLVGCAVLGGARWVGTGGRVWRRV
jgi:hypothetical protein